MVETREKNNDKALAQSFLGSSIQTGFFLS
jgi:hypothetical protein